MYAGFVSGMSEQSRLTGGIPLRAADPEPCHSRPRAQGKGHAAGPRTLPDMASKPHRMVWACIACGKPGEPGKELSYRGKCRTCSTTRATEAAEQMAAKHGPYYDRWREAYIAAALDLAGR